MSTPAPGAPARKHAVLAGIGLAVTLFLVVSDPDRTFQWILTRLLGVNLAYAAFAFLLWAQERPWWNNLFAGGLAADLGLRILDLTPFRYLPPLLIALWLRGVLIPVAYAGAFREATKEKTRGETQKAMLACLAAGIFLHYVLVGPLIDAVLCLLSGKYP